MSAPDEAKRALFRSLPGREEMTDAELAARIDAIEAAARAVRREARAAVREAYREEPGDRERRRRSPRVTAAQLAAAEAGYWAMTPDERAAARWSMNHPEEMTPAELDALAEAALAPVPFELTDAQCAQVAALLAPYAEAGQ